MTATSPDLPAAPGTEHHPVAQTLAKLHPWIDFVPQQQRRLGLFIFLALLAHLTAFFFIRIDSTRAEMRHEPRTHVTMENGPLPAGAGGADAFWDTLTDPRLFLLPVGPLDRFSSDEPPIDLAAINPSLGTPRLPAPAPGANSPFTSPPPVPLAQQVAAEMQPPRQPFSYDETPPVLATKTTWEWDPTLARRQPSNEPALPSPVSDTDLSPTELRVALSPDGVVQHVLLEETCQKPELDQQAILAVRKVLFRSSDRAGLQWGRVTIFWHYTPTPVEVVVPTPPAPPQ
jgi:hypothetical protein